ncbi:hypothetical protein E8E13_006319 [Curvularia kusanoi]|uniref:YDG domain-containing protein n=1 Tax=Curvularia kusanoi TaxID=90978 RepID=A0A9P4T9R9_CURKU|nr:hypothetical protein E8E13_006319 [Curvularia kusanoi]
MPHTYYAVPLLPVTSTIPDVPRPTLKLLARWIRDDLDILVSREGPGVLRPDDVVTLHEYLVALRQSTTVTARDLRATGIHKAVKDISGIATRWPGRLIEECDKLIVTWTDKFGPLDNLPPFLYGRGGRLEGIGSVNESTLDTLLDRWREHCPEKVDHKVSHRHGSLGFSPGTWWIGPIFAHHAGIIGIESVKGGTTFDKHGAYALVLNDTGEVDTINEHYFTYRCPVSDKGKYRLTAATARSRDPIRILRNHSATSIWGPKAGTRYEGLYSVKAWCVRQAKLKDIMRGVWNEGDIIYEISLERTDPAPMEDVTRRPTNMEVDDYAEYKRLRRIHREQLAKGTVPLPVSPEKAPPLQPSQLPVHTPVLPQSLLRTLPSVPHNDTLEELALEASGVLQAPLSNAAYSALTPTIPSSPQEDPLFSSVISNLPISVKEGNANIGQLHPQNLASPDKTPPDHQGLTPVIRGQTPVTQGQSPATQGQTPVTSSGSSNKDDLKEIIPWIDLEPELVAFRSSAEAGQKEQAPSQPAGVLGAKAAELNPVKNVRRLARDTRKQSTVSMLSQKPTVASALRLISAKPMHSGNKDPAQDMKREKPLKKVLFGKARFLDGTGYSADEEEDNYRCPPSKMRRFRSNSMDAIPQLYCPAPIRPPRPHSLFNYGIEDIEFTSPLNNLVSRPGMASPVNSLVSSSVMITKSDRAIGQDIALRRLKRWLSK